MVQQKDLFFLQVLPFTPMLLAYFTIHDQKKKKPPSLDVPASLSCDRGTVLESFLPFTPQVSQQGRGTPTVKFSQFHHDFNSPDSVNF